MPFLLLASIQSAGSHLSSPMGLSSKIVPSFTENCRPQSRHFQMRRVLRKPGSLASHAGQVTPLGQRSEARKVRATSLSAKYRTASVSELGRCLVFMPQTYSRGLGVSSMLLPLLGGVPFTIAAAISLRKGIPQPLPDTPSRLLTQPTPTARYPRVPPGCATLSPFDAPGHGAEGRCWSSIPDCAGALR